MTTGGSRPGTDGQFVLLLGGTGEARELAQLLLAAQIPFESTLAGRVERPRLPVGAVRMGGFGGVEGLVEYLAAREITAVVDATHPFATGMSANAIAATNQAGVPLVRLERPGWSGRPDASEWHWVQGHDEAASAASNLGHRPLLTIGRQHLAAFVGPLADAEVTARVVDQPDLELPARWQVLHSRGPYTLEGERNLMVDARTDVLVTKDSGGSWTWPKMAAATELGIPIVVVRRHSEATGTNVVADAAAALDWVRTRVIEQ